ncbi:MAG TPA: hypothetical protein VK066_01885 [Chloroflexota bacterium]|nr:hypothetical protein [Chloroflexota bacterium]
MSTRRKPTLNERDAFMLKLIAFRAELPPRQQRMLDAMALAAFCEEPDTERVHALLGHPHLPHARDDTPWMNLLSGEY